MAEVADLISRLKTKLKDPAGMLYTDEEYEAVLLDALHRYDDSLTWETLGEAEEYLVLNLAASSCAFSLAAGAASKIMISVDGLSINQSRIASNWMELGREFEKAYNDGIQDGHFEVTDAKRYSVLKNRMVG